MFDIRFIALNDNVDSYKNPASINNILVPFKNLINDEYARDNSVKVRTALNARKKRGEFVGSFAAYGYIKAPDDKHKLIIDENAANIIKQIFKWAVEEGLRENWMC